MLTEFLRDSSNELENNACSALFVQQTTSGYTVVQVHLISVPECEVIEHSRTSRKHTLSLCLSVTSYQRQLMPGPVPMANDGFKLT